MTSDELAIGDESAVVNKGVALSDIARILSDKPTSSDKLASPLHDVR